jgi:hypothetical protein
MIKSKQCSLKYLKENHLFLETMLAKIKLKTKKEKAKKAGKNNTSYYKKSPSKVYFMNI